MDEVSKTLDSVEINVAGINETTICLAELEIPDDYPSNRDLNAWAHLSISGKKQISTEDFITTRAYPVSILRDHTKVYVELKPVSR